MIGCSMTCNRRVTRASSLLLLIMCLSIPQPGRAQPGAVRVMLVTDDRNVTHEISDYGLVWCYPERVTQSVRIRRGSAEERYPLDDVERIQSSYVNLSGRAIGRWDLRLTLRSGEVVVSQDNAGAGCVYIVGRTRTGGEFRLQLSSARNITFRAVESRENRGQNRLTPS